MKEETEIRGKGTCSRKCNGPRGAPLISFLGGSKCPPGKWAAIRGDRVQAAVLKTEFWAVPRPVSPGPADALPKGVPFSQGPEPVSSGAWGCASGAKRGGLEFGHPGCHVERALDSHKSGSCPVCPTGLPAELFFRASRPFLGLEPASLLRASLPKARLPQVRSLAVDLPFQTGHCP